MIAIYARVSTEEQAKKGYSLHDQIRACRKIANSYDIAEYVDEGISGEILARPELSKLRNALRDGLITKVICLDPDRLSRKLMNQLIISEEIERKASLVFVNGEYSQTAEGKLFYQLRGAISEFEKAKINERMCRGRREKARQGKIVSNYSVYGYDFDDKTSQFIINSFEAEIVKTIFNLFTETNRKIHGINGIAKYLSDNEIPTKRKAPVWHRQVVRQILMNKAYIGEFYQNRWNCEGILVNRFEDPKNRIQVQERPKDEWILVPCPSIVDKNTFMYAQELLKESRRRWAGTSKNQYLLSGLVRCGVCGNTMPGRKAKNWGKYVFEYYDIKSTAGYKNRGCGNKVTVEELDEQVWELVAGLLSNPDNIPDEDQGYPILTYENTDFSRTEKRIAEIKKARHNLINLMSSMGDELGENALNEIRQKLRNMKNEEEHLLGLKEEQINLEKTLASPEIRQNLIREASIFYLSQRSSELPFEDKKHLIQSIVREVKVYRDEIKVFGF